jgi:hypothetical protein
MASCEKCWSDAYARTFENPRKSHSDHYSNLIKERLNNPCTPEEQAGIDATICTKCDRKTVHQYTRKCIVCN